MLAVRWALVDHVHVFEYFDICRAVTKNSLQFSNLYRSKQLLYFPQSSRNKKTQHVHNFECVCLANGNH